MDFRDDPRVVSVDHNGETLRFWWHRRAVQTAKEKYGYEPPQTDPDSIDEFDFTEFVLRQLWIAHLSFNPDMSFEEFDMLFLPGDYAKLGRAANEMQEKQFPKVDDEPVKNAEAQSSTK